MYDHICCTFWEPCPPLDILIHIGVMFAEEGDWQSVDSEQESFLWEEVVLQYPELVLGANKETVNSLKSIFG